MEFIFKYLKIIPAIQLYLYNIGILYIMVYCNVGVCCRRDKIISCLYQFLYIHTVSEITFLQFKIDCMKLVYHILNFAFINRDCESACINKVQ